MPLSVLQHTPTYILPLILPRGIDWSQVKGVHAQILQILQFIHHSQQVTALVFIGLQQRLSAKRWNLCHLLEFSHVSSCGTRFGCVALIYIIPILSPFSVKPIEPLQVAYTPLLLTNTSILLLFVSQSFQCPCGSPN